MTTDGESPELGTLHSLWQRFEQELREAELGEDRQARVLEAVYRYRDEAVVYRLSTADRTAELKLRIKNDYYKSLRYEWFSELNDHEIVEVLPLLVRASMHWDPSGNPLLVGFVNTALDALPRDRAGSIYLNAFTDYLRGFGYYARARPEERDRLLRDYMWLDRQHLYRSSTALENREALREVIGRLLGEEAVPVYEAGLEAAQDEARGQGRS